MEALKKEIYKLKPMWERELMPEEWKEAVTVPLQKKGDKQICSNYREISLLNTVYKIFSKILLGRLNDYTKSIIGEQRTGFMKGRSTKDQISYLNRLILFGV